MPIHPRRVFVPITSHPADANTLFHYPAEKAAWIWHPDKGATETCVLRFRLKFTLKEAASPLLHVTADQRFQLRCDGEDVTFGPDRCDLAHWTVQTVQLNLAPGEHELEAVAWFITEIDGTLRDGDAGSLEDSKVARPPMAQMSWRGGFLLYGEGVDASLLTTGQAPWSVEDLSGAVKMVRPQIPHYLDVGPTFTFDLEKWAERKAKPATVVMPPLVQNVHGVRRPGWALFPAELPEQRRESWRGGRIRAFRANGENGPYQAAETKAGEIAAWQELIAKGKALTIPAKTECTVLWDFENYCCGYPITETEGGQGAVISWNWAEGLYEAPSVDKIENQTGKGNRNEIEGKVFSGLEDGWIIGPGAKSKTPSLWWRCGRYVQLRVKTAGAPLTITGLSMLTTGYPLDPTASWKSSDASWDKLIPLFVRAYQIAGHETWTDTPYYEQMCYVGDNLLNAVANYAWFQDARLSRRSIELYEWSRRATGMVAERYPSGWRQECGPFALYWPVMVRDYAWWRDDGAFIKSMLPGVRSLVAEFDALVQDDGLLHHIPGWPFCDWVPGWEAGCAPGSRKGDSSIVNLQWVMTLLATAQVEEAHGEPLYAQRHRKVARETMDRIVARYWDAKRGLFLDTRGESTVSEHAQMYALLTGLLDADKTKACLAALRTGLDWQATISSAFYVLEALYTHGDAAEFYRRLEYWRGLPAMGFTATPEAPEPTRSDSHPWGAHPLYHTAASIAGVRPTGPAFSKVRVAPMPGDIENFGVKVVHPKGFVEVTFQKTSGKSAFSVKLPNGVSGEFAFQGHSQPLKPGKNEISL
jgi:hypothetical protein